MKNPPLLPSMNRDGDQTAATSIAIAGAIADLFLPAAGTVFAQICGQMIKKRMEQAQEILIEALRNGQKINLSDDKYLSFVPMGFRFYEAARRGENNSKLKLLGKLIVGMLGNEQIDIDEFNRISSKIERLSNNDIILMSKIYKMFLDNKNLNDENNHGYFFIRDIEDGDFMNNAYSVSSIQAAGFLITDPIARWKDLGDSYYPTSDFFVVCRTAITV